MPAQTAEICEVCGNHAVLPRRVQDALIRECEFCGHMEGPADLVELLELQREADAIGCDENSFPLARFIDELPGVKLIGDSGGDLRKCTMPFVAFELTDRRTGQLENLGQAMRLMRHELSHEWVIEFTFDFQLGFELKPRPAANPDPAEVTAAREDMLLIWRKLRGYSVLSWWKT